MGIAQIFADELCKTLLFQHNRRYRRSKGRKEAGASRHALFPYRSRNTGALTLRAKPNPSALCQLSIPYRVSQPRARTVSSAQGKTQKRKKKEKYS